MLLLTITINKFLHVIASVTLVGSNVATFFYIMHSQRQQQKTLVQYALRASFYGDALNLILISVILITAIVLQQALHLSYNTAWIKVAHIAFGLNVVLWLTQMMMRIISYKQKKLICFNIYIALSIITGIIFILIIRDASTHSTWITWLGGK